jgi:phenylpropionate dioxygenase-like ring-hydroxylating dioxygenase large terminal subunit
MDFSFLGKSVNESTALPKQFFTDPDIFELEKQQLFRNDWVAVARIDQLSSPGDYITYDLAGDPIIVACDKTGNINAFSNVCLHRACAIAQGAGNQKNLFTCPYHKWTYELNGKLRGAPNMELASDFDRNINLPALAVEIWQGWVFVHAGDDPKPLAPSLEEFNEKLAPWNVADLKTAGVLTFDSPWNWKVLLENFMESYHHMGVHRMSLNGIYPHSGTYPEETVGNYTLLENPSIDESISPPFWVGLVYPSMMFAMTRKPDSPVIGWYQMNIKSVERFELKIHVLVPQKMIDDGTANESLAAFDHIHREDIPMCDAVWRGLHSSQYTPGRLSFLEGCIYQFHSYLRDKLQA